MEVDGDARISELFGSSDFQKANIEYTYGDKIYTIFVLNNPGQLDLWAEGMPSLKNWTFVMSSKNSLPPELKNHLEALQPKRPGEVLSDLEGAKRQYNIEVYDKIGPVVTKENFDAELKECFASAEKVNTVFLYKIQGEVTMVRVVVNPAEVKEKYKDFPEVTFTWPHKVGVMTNREAPEELLEHITKIYQETLPRPKGWIDYILSFFKAAPELPISNGARPEFQVEGVTYEQKETHFELFSRA